MHEGIDLTQIAMIVLATLGCGLLFERIKQPAVLGYILGGVILSLFNQTLDRTMIEALAELGVIMLLFLIGMELSLRSFKQIWVVSVGMALVQLGVSVVVVLILSKLFSLSHGLAMVLAFSIALSSTAVAIKMLDSIGELRSETGQVAVGILIAQDLLIVPLIMYIRGMGGDGLGYDVLVKITIAVVLLIGIVFALTRRERFKLPFCHLYANHEDLQPLVAMLFCFGFASLSGLIGLSAAYGAFLGGLVIGNSSERQTMIHATKPIQSVLMMVFFLSVGLLLDFAFIWEHFAKVFILLIFITLGKTALNIGALNLFRQPWSRAFLAGLIVSQMGEFAFVLSSIGADVSIIDAEGQKLVVSLAALSLVLSPFWLMAARRLNEMGPKPTASADEIMTTAYGPQLEAISKIKDTCKQFATSLTQKSDDEKIDDEGGVRDAGDDGDADVSKPSKTSATDQEFSYQDSVGSFDVDEALALEPLDSDLEIDLEKDEDKKKPAKKESKKLDETESIE